MGKITDISRQRFGRLTAISLEGVHSRIAYWNCKCDCGKTVTVRGTHLRDGNTKSCGCYHIDRTTEANTKHGLHHGDVYFCWQTMIQRCTNPNATSYRLYGGRGITVCERWLTLEQFIADVGPRPSKAHSLDRYPNPDGNYEPGNVRWATRKEQANNKSKL